MSRPATDSFEISTDAPQASAILDPALLVRGVGQAGVFTVCQNGKHLPLVAVVTPVYNGGDFLGPAMQCVQAQTYPNLVHIVLDNASTDDTARVIRANLDGPHPVLVYTNAETLPQQANWNKAFSYLPEAAVYTKLLCADDLMRADCIERFVAIAEADPDVQIVVSDDVFDDRVLRANLPKNVDAHDGRAVARSCLSSDISWLSHHHFFVRIDDAARGENFCGSSWSQDLLMVMRLCLKGKLGYVHEPLIYTRWHQESATGREVKTQGVKREMIHLQMILEFGPQALGGDYASVVQKFLRRMARLCIWWSLSGERGRARAMLAGLADHGFSFTAMDYVTSVLDWPRYFLGKCAASTPIGPAITAAEFVKPGKETIAR